MHIDFDDRTETLSNQQIDILKNLLLFVGKEEDIPNQAELSVSFVDNDEIKALNHAYRNKDEVTDVLSFALQEGTDHIEYEASDMPYPLGDIVISLSRAKDQAEEYNHSFKRELAFLCVHGLLHVLGYDHMNDHDEREMFSKQHKLLEKFGIER